MIARAVREVTLAVPSVSCANSACARLRAERREIVPLVHQHGCSQLGDDVALTREILAGLIANPNVVRSVIIGLGCESNRPDDLARRARARGGNVSVVGIQSSGGLAEAVNRARDELAAMPPRAIAPHTVRVGVMADESAGFEGERLSADVAAALLDAGFRVVLSSTPLSSLPIEVGVQSGVPDAWQDGGLTAGEACDELGIPNLCFATVKAGVTDVERLTALAAVGAEVTVLLTGCGSPIGSPIAPTVTVSTSNHLDVLDDIFDVPFAAGAELGARTVEAVETAASGLSTLAERAGARDVAIWRLAPYF